MDKTEMVRREMVIDVNNRVISDDPDSERVRLEKEHGQVWDTEELQRDFDVLAFAAPMVIVKEKETGVEGALLFQHTPRFYFGFVKA